MTDPAKYDVVLDDLRFALEKLSMGAWIDLKGDATSANTTLGLIQKADSDLENWKGDAADDFRTNFISPFQAITSNQFLAVAALKSALEAHQAVWRQARADVDKIAHDTIDALGQIIAGQSEVDWEVALTVVASVAQVIVSFIPPAAAAGAVVRITFVGAAAQAGATLVDEGPARPKSVNEVLTKMEDALARVGKERYDKEHDIAKKVDELHSAIFEQGNSRFVAPRPLLANTNPGDVTSDSYLGEAD